MRRFHRDKMSDETTGCFAAQCTGGLHIVTLQYTSVKHVLDMRMSKIVFRHGKIH